MGITPTRRAVMATGIAAAALPRRARAQQKPIRIGVLTDMTGAYAANTGPGSVLGAQMAIEDFSRAHPGAEGRAGAGRSAAEARCRAGHRGDWFDNQGVDVVTDVPLSSAAFAIGDLAKAKDKVAIFTGGASADITGDALRAEPSALGLRHLVDAAWRGGCGGEGRRRHLVLHHRRLRLRPFAGEGRCQLSSPRLVARCWARRRHRSRARPISRRSWCRRRRAGRR